jgi:hypothetical protein
VLLPVRASAAAGEYSLLLRLDPDIDGGAQDGNLADLGAIQVRERDVSNLVTVPPSHQYDLEATFGDVATLIGADALSRVKQGQDFTATLVWEAVAPTATGYKVSVQLVSESGDIVAQHDSEPAEWTRPTTGWLPGEFVVDHHQLEIPDDAPSGEYLLIARMYEPRTLAPLAVSGSNVVDGAARIAPVYVGTQAN